MARRKSSGMFGQLIFLIILIAAAYFVFKGFGHDDGATTDSDECGGNMSCQPTADAGKESVKSIYTWPVIGACIVLLYLITYKLGRWSEGK